MAPKSSRASVHLVFDTSVQVAIPNWTTDKYHVRISEFLVAAHRWIARKIQSYGRVCAAAKKLFHCSSCRYQTYMLSYSIPPITILIEFMFIIHNMCHKSDLINHKMIIIIISDLTVHTIVCDESIKCD